jgi:hypothetical protein
MLGPTKASARGTPAYSDHLVGDGEQRWRHFDAKHARGLQVDDNSSGRLHHRRVAGLP